MLANVTIENFRSYPGPQQRKERAQAWLNELRNHVS